MQALRCFAELDEGTKIRFVQPLAVGRSHKRHCEDLTSRMGGFRESLGINEKASDWRNRELGDLDTER